MGLFALWGGGPWGGPGGCRGPMTRGPASLGGGIPGGIPDIPGGGGGGGPADWTSAICHSQQSM